MTDIDPNSLLGQALEPYLNGRDEIYVAPAIGVNFVEPWRVL